MMLKCKRSHPNPRKALTAHSQGYSRWPAVHLKVIYVFRSAWMKTSLLTGLLWTLLHLSIRETNLGHAWAAALTLNKLPWDCPCPESDLAKAGRKLLQGEDNKLCRLANYPPTPTPMGSKHWLQALAPSTARAGSSLHLITPTETWVTTLEDGSDGSLLQASEDQQCSHAQSLSENPKCVRDLFNTETTHLSNLGLRD